MQKKLIALLVLAFIVCNLLAFINEANSQVVTENKDKKPSVISVWWDNFMKRTYLFPLTMALMATLLGIIFATVRRDKLLKSLSGQLITIEMRDGKRFRGRLRVEAVGLEVIEEKTKEGKDSVSFIIRIPDEKDGIHALVRYLDLLTEKEKERREDELKRAFHPGVLVRLARFIRNIINRFRRVLSDAFNLIFTRRLAPKLGSFAQEIGGEGQKTVEYMTGSEADYDSLIDRLIGTKVIVRTTGNIEYIGVFKDYTKDYIELLDVSYKNNWSITVNRDEGYAKHDRGIILSRNGDNIVFQSRSPFSITLKSMAWREGPQDVGKGDANTTLLIVPPFGQIEYNMNPPAFDKVISPFEKLQLPMQYSYANYKFIAFSFESVRTADIVMAKNYGIIRHRTEKYEPKLLDINSITETLLTTKEESFLLKDNPSGTTMIIHNGHITNMPRERMDVREIEDQISQRWAVDSFFETIDKKIRPIIKFKFIGKMPLRRTKGIMGLFYLIALINEDKNRKNDPILPYIYRAILAPNKRKKQKTSKKRIHTKKPNRLLDFIKKSLKLNQPQKA